MAAAATYKSEARSPSDRDEPGLEPEPPEPGPPEGQIHREHEEIRFGAPFAPPRPTGPGQPLNRIAWSTPVQMSYGWLWHGQDMLGAGGSYRIAASKDGKFAVGFSEWGWGSTTPSDFMLEFSPPQMVGVYDSLDDAQEHAERHARYRAYQKGVLVPPDQEAAEESDLVWRPHGSGFIANGRHGHYLVDDSHAWYIDKSGRREDLGQHSTMGSAIDACRRHRPARGRMAAEEDGRPLSRNIEWMTVEGYGYVGKGRVTGTVYSVSVELPRGGFSPGRPPVFVLKADVDPINPFSGRGTRVQEGGNHEDLMLVADRMEQEEWLAAGEDRLSYADRQALPDSAFALPHRRELPIINRSHVGPAASRLSMMRNQGSVTHAEYEEAHRRIMAAGQRFGVEVNEESKSMKTHGAREALKWKKHGDDVLADGSLGRYVIHKQKANRKGGVLPYSLLLNDSTLQTFDKKTDAKAAADVYESTHTIAPVAPQATPPATAQAPVTLVWTPFGAGARAWVTNDPSTPVKAWFELYPPSATAGWTLSLMREEPKTPHWQAPGPWNWPMRSSSYVLGTTFPTREVALEAAERYVLAYGDSIPGQPAPARGVISPMAPIHVSEGGAAEGHAADRDATMRKHLLRQSHQLDKEVEQQNAKLRRYPPGSDQYEQAVKRLHRLQRERDELGAHAKAAFGAGEASIYWTERGPDMWVGNSRSGLYVVSRAADGIWRSSYESTSGKGATGSRHIGDFRDAELAKQAAEHYEINIVPIYGSRYAGMEDHAAEAEDTARKRGQRRLTWEHLGDSYVAFVPNTQNANRYVIRKEGWRSEAAGKWDLTLHGPPQFGSSQSYRPLGIFDTKHDAETGAERDLQETQGAVGAQTWQPGAEDGGRRTHRQAVADDIERAADAWERAGKGKRADLAHVYASDAVELRKIAALVRAGDDQRAQIEARGLDSRIRDELPGSFYDLLKARHGEVCVVCGKNETECPGGPGHRARRSSDPPVVHKCTKDTATVIAQQIPGAPWQYVQTYPPHAPMRIEREEQREVVTPEGPKKIPVRYCGKFMVLRCPTTHEQFLFERACIVDVPPQTPTPGQVPAAPEKEKRVVEATKEKPYVARIRRGRETVAEKGPWAKASAAVEWVQNHKGESGDRATVYEGSRVAEYRGGRAIYVFGRTRWSRAD